MTSASPTSSTWSPAPRGATGRSTWTTGGTAETSGPPAGKKILRSIVVVLGYSAELATSVQVVENELIHGGNSAAIGVGQPDQLVNFVARSQGPLIVGGVAGHAHLCAARMAVRLGLEGTGVRGTIGRDDDVELFADLADEGLDIGLAWLAFTARGVIDVFAA